MKIALNIFYIKDKEICPVYISKINSNCDKNSLNDAKGRKRFLWKCFTNTKKSLFEFNQYMKSKAVYIFYAEIICK